MPKDYAARAITDIRRKDRAVSDEAWIKDFLHRAAFGHMASLHQGQPFINSNLFVYDEAQHCIYLHTARVGRTAANIALQQAVCFSVSTMGRILPAAHALDFSVEYQGVAVFGQAHIVLDDDEASQALQQLLDKYAPHLQPGRDYRAIQADELARTAVYRIDIHDWSGKRKQAAPDFPGAFSYPLLED